MGGWLYISTEMLSELPLEDPGEERGGGLRCTGGVNALQQQGLHPSTPSSLISQPVQGGQAAVFLTAILFNPLLNVLKGWIPSL